MGSLSVNYQPQAVAAHPTLSELVVAGKVSGAVGREIEDEEQSVVCI